MDFLKNGLGLGFTSLIIPVLYVVYILVVLLTLFYRIEIGILFFVFVLPQENILKLIQQYPLGENFVNVLVFALIIRWVLNKRKSGAPIFVKTPFNVPLLILVLWTYIGLWRGASYLSIEAPITPLNPRFVMWRNFVLLPLLFLIIVNNVENPKLVKLIVITMALSMLSMDRAFYGNFLTPSHFAEKARKSGAFSYLGPNELAIFYAENSLILVSLFLLDRNKWRKVLFGVTSCFNYYCVIFLYSRAAFFVTLTGWIFLGLVRDRKMLIPVVGILLFWRTLMPVSVVERIDMTRTADGEYDESTEVRFGIWERAWDIFSTSPIIGVGFATTPYLNIKDGISNIVRKNVHNGFLGVAMEQGLFGLVIFLMPFFMATKAGWRLYKLSREGFVKGLGLGLVASVIAIMVANIAGYNWHYLSVMGYFWISVGLVVRSTTFIQRETHPTSRHCPEVV